MEEYIIAPAAKKGDEVRISRFCHAELISYDGFFKCAEQGFITSFNRFVDRKEALKIAKQNNENLNKLCESDELYSEDLFINEHELINKSKELTNHLDMAVNEIYGLRKENKELEKMVDEMAEHIVSSAVVDDTVCAIKFCEIEEDCTYEKMLECTKQYFKKKASDNNE